MTARISVKEGDILCLFCVVIGYNEGVMNPPSPQPFATSLADGPDGLAVFADLLPQLVWSARPDGIPDYFNRRWYGYTGQTPDQNTGGEWAAVLHPDDAARSIARWNQALQSGDPYDIEYRIRRASDGAYRWFLARGEPIRDAEGRITRWFGTCTDIDDQKRAELELAEVSRRERTISEALQGTVQPTLPEGVPGLDLASYYRAALHEANVGGDFSDVFPLEKGRHCLVVGDLSGKGLAAAAQVAVVRNMLRYAIYTERTIAEGITRLNHILITNNLLSGFATLVVCTFDLGAKTLTYVSCGQEPALLRRTAGGLVEELPPTGPILGMTDTAQYTEETLSLVPGDAFALYTDGLTEVGPNRIDLLGVQGLAALMSDDARSAREIADHIVHGAEDFSNGVFRDDVCLLVGIVQGGGTEY